MEEVEDRDGEQAVHLPGEADHDESVTALPGQQQQLLLQLCLDFFSAAVQTVLFSRGVYADYLFSRALYQGISVPQARHPQIVLYIQQVLNQARPLLQAVKDSFLTLHHLTLTFTH